MRPKALLFVFLLMSGTVLWAQEKQSAAIAYVNGQHVVVADSSDSILRSVPFRFKHQILQVAVNADGTALIATIQTFGRGEFGGDLYLWTIATNRWSRLTFGPYVFKVAEEGHREVYDGPAFSPSGKHIAFAIHWESLYDDNDVVDAAGPVALMDIKNGRIRAIKSTLGDQIKDPTGPPWYANSPQWAADEKRLLVSFESGFATIDLATGRLHDFAPETNDTAGTFAVNWLTSDKVLFLSFSEDQAKAPVPHSLTLNNATVTSAPERFRSLAGKLLAFNSAVSVVEVAGGREVHGRSVWKLPTPGIFGLVPLLQ